MASYAGEVWIGGSFAAGPGRDFAHLVGGVWTGFALGNIRPGASGTAVHCMAVHDGELIIGGSFPERVTRWDGAAVTGSFGSTLYCGFSCSGAVQSLLSDGGTLYAAGSYRLYPSNLTPGVMRWDGSAWTALTVPAVQAVRSISTYDGNLVLCTSDTQGNNSTLMRWTDGAWTVYGPFGWRAPLSPGFSALGTLAGKLYLGGTFTDVIDAPGGAPRPVRMIAQWDGVRASIVSRGVDARVTAMLPWSGGDTLAVGRFRQAGAQPAHGIALYGADGFWRPFEGNRGFNADAWCATMHEGSLVVGGSFSQAGGVAVGRVARWNGGGWEAMGDIATYPAAVASVGGALLMATTTSGGSLSGYEGVYRWNGVEWALLPGTAQTTRLFTLGDRVYINAPFTLPVRPVMRWNGSAFEPMTMPPGETALTILGSRGGVLHATGARGIYRWSGSAFERVGPLPSLGGSFAGPDTADDGTLLHVPTNFSQTIEQVYSWDGYSWGTQGSMPLVPAYSTGQSVISLRPPALYVRGEDLLVGGAFQYTDAGRNRPGAYFARQVRSWRPMTTAAPPEAVEVDPGGTITLNWELTGGAVTSRRWYRNGVALSDGEAPGVGVTTGATTSTLTITGAGGLAEGAYLCVASSACGQVTLRTTPVRVRCDGDFTLDGMVDQDDVAYLVNAIAGGGNPSGRDLDFNRDGNVDQEDYLLLVHVAGGGACP
jgi:trimeric autotransporter adhesin